MKTFNMKSTVGKVAIAGALMALPISTYALDAQAKSSVSINNDGIVRVLGAEVTSVSGSIVNAVARLKNTLINFAFTTNASTTVQTTSSNGTATASLADLQVGEKVNVTGTLTSLGSVLGVTATKVHENTPKVFATTTARIKSGTVQSVNASNGTFVIHEGDKNYTVQTGTATSFTLGTGTAGTLANLSVGTKVAVLGTMSADGTVITATKVIAKPVITKEWKNEWKNFFKNYKNDHRNDHINR